MGTPVRDRSGRGLPPKAERRALGKAAARKRAAQRRRRELLNRVMQIAGPVVAIAAIIGVVWFFSGGEDGTTATPGAGAAATSTAPAQPTPTWSLPAGLDPQLGTKPEVTAGDGTPLTDLKVTTLIAGTGAPLQTGQTVTVNYVGVSYASGEEFDASWNRGQPFEFQLGGGVIDGWNQGLVGVPVGSRVQLDIPSALAYGDDPAGGQPAGDLRFVVDVLAAS